MYTYIYIYVCMCVYIYMCVCVCVCVCVFVRVVEQQDNCVVSERCAKRWPCLLIMLRPSMLCKGLRKTAKIISYDNGIRNGTSPITQPLTPCRFNRLRRSCSRGGRAPCRLALSLAETDVRRHVLSTPVFVPTFEVGLVRRQVYIEVTDAARNGQSFFLESRILF